LQYEKKQQERAEREAAEDAMRAKMIAKAKVANTEGRAIPHCFSRVAIQYHPLIDLSPDCPSVLLTVIFTIVKRPIPGTESKLEVKCCNSTTVEELKSKLFDENADMPPPPDITLRNDQAVMRGKPLGTYESTTFVAEYKADARADYEKKEEESAAVLEVTLYKAPIDDLRIRHLTPTL